MVREKGWIDPSSMIDASVTIDCKVGIQMGYLHVFDFVSTKFTRRYIHIYNPI